MKDILLYQTQEMITNFIEGEHNGAIQITEVSMEDYSYNNEDGEHSLNITIDYIPSAIGVSEEEPRVTIDFDGKSFAKELRKQAEDNLRNHIKSLIK